jgi:anti-anti-sigma factor
MSSTYTSVTLAPGPVAIVLLDREKLGEHECKPVEAEVLQAAAGARHRVVIDCSRVTMIASAGLGLLVTLDKECKKQGGKLAICELGEQLLMVLKLTKLDRLLRIVPDQEAALKAVS